MWFKELFGFDEISPSYVRENLILDDRSMVSKANNQTFSFGILETADLKTLIQNCPPREVFKGRLHVSELVGNIRSFHQDESNKHALFQAASQFNLLEMVGPHITPEHGIDIYDRDLTQGPACAIACGAGTVYRNYFVPVKGQKGQTENNQIDCLSDIGEALGNDEFDLWKMQNGYALANKEGLKRINDHITQLTSIERDQLKEKLRIGIQWDTEVTISESRHLVTQAYCSALPVAYSQVSPEYWEPFARLILEATYEATLYAALINFEKNDCNKVFLTMVGGGAFGNRTQWICEAMIKALRKFVNTPLDVKIVSYGQSDPSVIKLVNEL